MSSLKERVLAYNTEIKSALELILEELNQGQRKKLLKNEKVKAMLDRYKIDYE